MVGSMSTSGTRDQCKNRRNGLVHFRMVRWDYYGPSPANIYLRFQILTTTTRVGGYFRTQTESRLFRTQAPCRLTICSVRCPRRSFPPRRAVWPRRSMRAEVSNFLLVCMGAMVLGLVDLLSHFQRGALQFVIFPHAGQRLTAYVDQFGGGRYDEISLLHNSHISRTV